MPGFLLNAGVIFNIALTVYKDFVAGKSVSENALSPAFYPLSRWKRA
jgi:hypothetical protein